MIKLLSMRITVFVCRMQCNTIAIGLIKNNMNSEKNCGSNQDKTEVKIDVGLKNDNQTTDQTAITSKVVHLESRVTGEQLKLNSNSENNIKLMISKTSIIFSNGTKSKQACTSDCANSLEKSASQDASNANVSSVFMSTTNIKSQNANTNTMCQLKHKTVVNTSALSLPKSQMYLNLFFTQTNIHLNYNIDFFQSYCNY